MAKTYNDGLESRALKQPEAPLQEGDAVITVTVTDTSDSFNYFFNVECMRSGELKNAGHVEWDSTLSPGQHRLIVRRGKPPAYALCGGELWAAIAKAEQ